MQRDKERSIKGIYIKFIHTISNITGGDSIIDSKTILIFLEKNKFHIREVGTHLYLTIPVWLSEGTTEEVQQVQERVMNGKRELKKTVNELAALLLELGFIRLEE